MPVVTVMAVARQKICVIERTTTINLDFNSSFTGEHFVLTAKGIGTDVSLAKNVGAILTPLAHDSLNFVSDAHRAMIGDRFWSSAHDLGLRGAPVTSAASQDFSVPGFESHSWMDHDTVHAAIGVSKA